MLWMHLCHPSRWLVVLGSSVSSDIMNAPESNGLGGYDFHGAMLAYFRIVQTKANLVVPFSLKMVSEAKCFCQCFYHLRKLWGMSRWLRWHSDRAGKFFVFMASVWYWLWNGVSLYLETKGKEHKSWYLSMWSLVIFVFVFVLLVCRCILYEGDKKWGNGDLLRFYLHHHPSLTTKSVSFTMTGQTLSFSARLQKIHCRAKDAMWCNVIMSKKNVTSFVSSKPLKCFQRLEWFLLLVSICTLSRDIGSFCDLFRN